MRLAASLLAVAHAAMGAEAGFEMPLTLSGGAFYSNAADNVRGGLRAVAYPTLSLGRHWYFSCAIQGHTRPYFTEQLGTQGNGVRADVLQAYLGYAHYWNRNSVIVRAGMLTSAFGSFLLRYDDAMNPLIDMPLGYGYYYKPVTTYGLPGAQIDLTAGAADMRVQFTASNPASRRGIRDTDQYGTWTAGGGWTIRQGYRLGASFYRGAYLYPGHRFFMPGERPPRELPSTGYGIDTQIARSHWNIQVELMRFQRAYKVIPTFSELMGYGEVRYVLSPRWYVAARAGHRQTATVPDTHVGEFGLGFRPSERQILKVSYQLVTGPGASKPDRILSLQWVARLQGPSVAFN